MPPLFQRQGKCFYPRETFARKKIFGKVVKILYVLQMRSPREARKKCVSVFKATVNDFIRAKRGKKFSAFFERNCKCFYPCEMSITLRSSSTSFVTISLFSTFLSNTDLQLLVLVRRYKPTCPRLRPTHPHGQKIPIFLGPDTTITLALQAS